MTDSTLTHRDHRVAFLLAIGRPPTEAGRAVGYGKKRLSNLHLNPTFVALIEQYRQEFFTQTAHTLNERLLADAPTTLKRLQELRDQRDDLKVALGASAHLFDRQVPKRTHHDEERTVRIIFSAEERAACKEIEAEAEALDVEEVPQ